VSRYGEVALGVECALPRTVPTARLRYRRVAKLAIVAALGGALYAGYVWKEAPLSAGPVWSTPPAAARPAPSVEPCAPPRSVGYYAPIATRFVTYEVELAGEARGSSARFSASSLRTAIRSVRRSAE
jgi:hypothetical protein